MLASIVAAISAAPTHAYPDDGAPAPAGYVYAADAAPAAPAIHAAIVALGYSPCPDSHPPSYVVYHDADGNESLHVVMYDDDYIHVIECA